jgi:hypothetical protein
LTGCNKTENVNEENVDETPSVETTQKESLDLGELIGLIENHFPKSYTFTKFNMTTNESEGSGKHIYNRMELGYLTPENTKMVDREVTSSGIEDGMIYTMVRATLDDGKQIDVLYIVNPETLDFVAANIEDGDITTNYQFSYDNVESLTYEDLEGIAEMNFPTSSTYTVVDLATEETTDNSNGSIITKISNSPKTEKIKSKESNSKQKFIELPDKPKGLNNFSLNCYMNSLLQCFYHIKGLRTSFIDPKQFSEETQKVCHSLSEVMKGLTYGDNYYYSPNNFKQTLGDIIHYLQVVKVQM